MNILHRGLAVLFTAQIGFAAMPAEPPLGPADFRYAPPWWQTAICLPDDPDKVLVGKEGQLLLDFLGRPLRNFGVIVQPDVAGGARWVRQETLSPRVPIVRTWKDADGVGILLESFVVTPGPGRSVAPARLVRADAQERLRVEDWAQPPAEAGFVWSGAETARNDRTMRYTLAVTPGARMWIVFGLCEGRQKEPGRRLLVFQAEGAEARTVDPVAEFGVNRPGLCPLAARDVNGDGVIEFSVDVPAGATERKPCFNAVWAFATPPPADDAFIRGGANDTAVAWLPGRTSPENRTITLLELHNATAAPTTRQPVLRLATAAPAVWSASSEEVLVGADTRISASVPLAPPGPREERNSLVTLPAITLQPGETRRLAFAVDRHRVTAAPALTLAHALDLREAARQWWENANLPHTVVEVPDPGMQAMIESSVRNIWQAREIIHGLPGFHVGPTVYRMLWVVDGAFLLETAALLDRAHDARAGLDHLLAHQQPDGSFEILHTYWKENGIVLWTMTRHALLTQDQAWLRARWPALRRVVAAIARLRAATAGDPAALNHGLLPTGLVDGGISNAPGRNPQPDYSNSYWCLAGLKAAIAAAQWLGETGDAAAWQGEYDGFHAALLRAMARDTLKDAHGNAYVPMLMANATGLTPQKGQWSFCHAVYPGQIFPADDPLVVSQLAMLHDTKVQGLVYDTGWMKDGLWTYFASFYGHARLWQGRGREAAGTLYDFARHASPTRVWREEQKPVGQGAAEVGDMPHNWASAEFIRLAIHLLELDRGDELHLLEGFPREWAGPGMVTRLNGVLTPFGPLHLEVRVAADGRDATVKVGRLGARPPAKLVLHLAGLTGEARTVDLPVDRDVERSFVLPH